MNVEVPKFRRCCFCIPLRYGIIIWGYINLLGSIITTGAFAFMSSFILAFSSSRSDIALVVLINGASLLDLTFNILLVVAAHQKNFKLLKIYYYYSIISVLIVTILYCINISYQLNYMMRYVHPYAIIKRIIVGVVYIALKIYLIMLIRSEASKLKNDAAFMFVNNATDAECKLTIEQKTTEQILKEPQNKNEPQVMKTQNAKKEEFMEIEKRKEDNVNTLNIAT